MKTVWLAFGLAGALLVTGCSGSGKDWPPPSPSVEPIPGFSASPQHGFNDWSHVFANASDAEASRNPQGMAYLVKEGDFILPFNIFTITASSKSYVDSQFEVLYCDDTITQIRAVEAKGDRVAIIDGGMTESGFNMSYSFATPGAKVRCGMDVYKLASDGWYLNSKLVHSFGGGED